MSKLTVELDDNYIKQLRKDTFEGGFNSISEYIMSRLFTDEKWEEPIEQFISSLSRLSEDDLETAKDIITDDMVLNSLLSKIKQSSELTNATPTHVSSSKREISEVGTDIIVEEIIDETPSPVVEQDDYSVQKKREGKTQAEFFYKREMDDLEDMSEKIAKETNKENPKVVFIETPNTYQANRFDAGEAEKNFDTINSDNGFTNSTYEDNFNKQSEAAIEAQLKSHGETGEIKKPKLIKYNPEDANNAKANIGPYAKETNRIKPLSTFAKIESDAKFLEDKYKGRK